MLPVFIVGAGFRATFLRFGMYFTNLPVKSNYKKVPSCFLMFDFFSPFFDLGGSTGHDSPFNYNLNGVIRVAAPFLQILRYDPSSFLNAIDAPIGSFLL